MTCVDVVIPYNPEFTDEDMLEEAIQSAEKQDIETNIILSEDDVSPSFGRNKGMKDSQCEYIAFLDADDKWLQGKLSKQIQEIEETDTGICIEGEEMSKDEFVEALLKNEIRPKTSSVLIKSDLDVKFDEELPRKEDDMFMIDAAMKDGICFVDEKIVELRKHEGGLTAHDDIFYIYTKYREFYEKVFNKYPSLEEHRPKIFPFFFFKSYVTDAFPYLKRVLKRKLGL